MFDKLRYVVSRVVDFGSSVLGIKQQKRSSNEAQQSEHSQKATAKKSKSNHLWKDHPIACAVLVRGGATPGFQFLEVIRSIKLFYMVGGGVSPSSISIINTHGPKTFINGAFEQSFKGGSREVHRGLLFGMYAQRQDTGFVSTLQAVAPIAVCDSVLNGAFDNITETRSKYLARNGSILQLSQLPKHLSLAEFLSGMKRVFTIGFIHSGVFYGGFFTGNNICITFIKPIAPEKLYEPISIGATAFVITAITNPVENVRKIKTGKGGENYKNISQACSTILKCRGAGGFYVGACAYFVQNCATGFIARKVLKAMNDAKAASNDASIG